MSTSKSFIRTIHDRKSIRSYNPDPLPVELTKKLTKIIKTNFDSPFQGESRFVLVKIGEMEKRDRKKFGTYGFIHGANSFLIGIIKKGSAYDLEHLGYIFEKIILHAAQLGLGTCWLGGTFKRSKLMLYLDLKENEYIPAITPVGFPSLKKTKRSQIIRKIAKSEKRKRWQQIFSDGKGSTPLLLNKEYKYYTPLEMVRLSPSASNFQPWRVVKSESKNIFNFFIYREKPFFHKRFGFPDFQRIDLGIACSHFNLACQELELPGQWVFKDPKLTVPLNYEYLISWREN